MDNNHVDVFYWKLINTLSHISFIQPNLGQLSIKKKDKNSVFFKSF